MKRYSAGPITNPRVRRGRRAPSSGCRSLYLFLLLSSFFLFGPEIQGPTLLASEVAPLKIRGLISPEVSEFEPVAIWQRTSVTLHVAASAQAFHGNLREATEAAFESWNRSGAQIPYLVIKEGADYKPSLKPDGVNTIMYAPIEFPGHEDDLAITIAFSNPKTLELTEADIVLNTRHDFSTELVALYGAQPEADSCAGQYNSEQCSTSYDLENVLAHEFGHFLGLGENFDDPRSTMFSCTSACEEHKRDLDESDQQAIQRAYENRVLALTNQNCQFQPSSLLLQNKKRILPLLSGILLVLIAFRRRHGNQLSGVRIKAPRGGRLNSID